LRRSVARVHRGFLPKARKTTTAADASRAPLTTKSMLGKHARSLAITARLMLR
jgi:hypothetical protein